MPNTEGIKLGCCYYVVGLGQVYGVQKWIYFGFSWIYM